MLNFLGFCCSFVFCILCTFFVLWFYLRFPGFVSLLLPLVLAIPGYWFWFSLLLTFRILWICFCDWFRVWYKTGFCGFCDLLLGVFWVVMVWCLIEIWLLLSLVVLCLCWLLILNVDFWCWCFVCWFAYLWMLLQCCFDFGV